MNKYWNPVRTFQGRGSFELLPDVLGGMNPAAKKIQFLTWRSSERLEEMCSRLKAACREVRVNVFEASNPTMGQLFQIYLETRDFHPDAIVAIGGGSVMDVSKSLCCISGCDLKSTDDLRRMILSGRYPVPEIRWIGVPTTSGTGSEVTCWATIWDPDMDAKRSVENHDNYAYAALVDPELAKSMPVRLAVSSALDACAHAVESYWSRNSNCVSRAAALEAIRLIMDHIDDLPDGDLEARDAMSKGSMLAGLAFSNTKTTACHSISYPLTMFYHIPHGAAVSLLLGPVFRMNSGCIREIGPLLAALGVRDGDELQNRITGLMRRVGIPASLNGWGVEYSDLPRLAELGITKGRADNNPVRITPAEVRTLLDSIYLDRVRAKKGERMNCAG